jgi:phosphoribosyl 1,2-cyclic phosphodiesterase
MEVTLFGVRGSLAAPGPATALWGGNTSTVQVVAADGTRLILDAGTGIRPLGDALPADVRRVDILLTHLHLDHIQGLGFFAPLYRPDVEVHVWGPPGHPGTTLSGRLSRYLSPPLFPVHLRELPNVRCHDLPPSPFQIGGVTVHWALVSHPDNTVGFRLEHGGAALTYLPDHEPALGLRDGVWLEPAWSSGHDLAAGADLLLHDSQYAEADYASRVGWGHSSFRHAFAFAARVGARALVPIHHDPSYDDPTLDRLFAEAVAAFPLACPVLEGREGRVLQVRAGAAD